MAHHAGLPAMRRLDEDTALAVLFANTRRKRRSTDLISVADACHYLKALYGSQRAVADKVGLSSEMVREFLALLRLPDEIKDMVRERKIDRLDVAYRIAMIRDPARQLDMAKQAASARSKDVRDIARLVGTTDLSVKESSARVRESKLRGLHVFIIDFDDDEYRVISARARSLRVKPAQLVQEAVLNWLNRENAGDSK